MERLPGSPDTPNRARRSHRQPNGAGRRLVIAVGSGAGLLGLGIAFGTGAVPMPLLSDSASGTPHAAMLDTSPPPVMESLSQASASPYGYALAKMPAVTAPHHKASPKPAPSMTATPTPSAGAATSAGGPSTHAASGLTPQATAQDETPSGQNQLAWSEAILTALGDPLTSANIVSMGYWMQNEAGKAPYGIVGANNPINVSEPGYGGTQIQYEAPGYYLMSYPSVSQGVAAIAAYLNNGSYSGVLNDLKQGAGLSDSALASELAEYSGGGYTTIPDSWGQTQGKPLG